MQAAILSLLTGDPNVDELPSKMDGEWPAYDVEATHYLDGRTVHHGTLAQHVTTEAEEPIVGEEFITTERREVRERVVTDFYADLESGWGGVTTSTGMDVLAEYLMQTAGVVPEDTRLDLDQWVEDYAAREDAEIWAAAYSHDAEESGWSEDRAQASFHADASLDALPADGVSAIGFQYQWDGTYTEGLAAQSGYVAVYSNAFTTDTFARWVASEIQPYLHHADDAQATLGDTERCAECTSTTRVEEVGGRPLCIVCRDAAEERGEA
jgi:hypothetical protein